MLTLKAKTRTILGKKVKSLREEGILPAILYGPVIKKPILLEIDSKDFDKIFKEAGESSLISLEIEGGEKSSKQKENLVLIHDTEDDPMTGKPTHVDFYQPRLDKEVEAKVPIVFEGEAPAVKELEGTLVRNISEVEVKALPQKLPKEIKVDVTGLKTFEDRILIKDLELPEGVRILKDPEEIVVLITPPEKVEIELEKPIAAPEGEPEIAGKKEKEAKREEEAVAEAEEKK